MEHSFWHSKWQNNEIGFHEPKGNALLVKYADTLLGGDSDLASEQRIFVPLCGKTRDIGWLLSKGASVVGAELSETAVQQLFEELGETPEISSTSKGKVYSKGELTIFVGDIFALTAQDIGLVTGVYDRAALVALPDGLREKYSTHLVSLTNNAPQLVISFEYDQSVMTGPPFSVDENTVSTLYSQNYHISLLERSTLEGGLKRKVAADNLVFHLQPAT
ncbi:MAG: thiopurine S-methyltransferase [Alteromonas sp. Nap_26]|nr:MAG: thiopurine S-methyltransferase [Alteromonas sp. Nap_26]